MNINFTPRRSTPLAKPPATMPARSSAVHAPTSPRAADSPPGELLTPAAAAGRLSVTSKVLERWRSNGEGPAFVRLSKKSIRYAPSAIDAFVAERTKTSTAAY